MTIRAYSTRRRDLGPGLLLAVLALLAQLAAGSAVPWHGADGRVADGALVGAICYAFAGPTGDGGAPAPHHPSDCSLCPYCQGVLQGGALVAPSVASVPASRVATVLAAAVPPARAPPSRPVTAASARGPPGLA